MLIHSCERWAHKPALHYKVRGVFQPISYAELEKEVYRAACALKSIGVEKSAVVAIFSENSKDWAILDWAVLTLGAVVVPIYPTLLEDQVGYILKDANPTVVFAGDSKLAELVERACVASKVNCTVVVLHGVSAGRISFSELLIGTDSILEFDKWREGVKEILPDDLATIIYTSGTTGEPKGVELTHRAFTFLCATTTHNLPISQSDLFLSFLPLSHVYERMAGHFLPISVGAEIAYSESLRTLAQDIISAKPTIFLTVPRFLESVKSKIMTSVAEGPKWKQKLFTIVASRGLARMKAGFKPVGFMGGLLDKMVGAKIRERFGGKLRFLVSGGATLPADLAEFYAAFGINVIQGYGLTETAPVITIDHPERPVPASVGEILPGIEVRIADDGEILMRGPSLMRGYHNKPEETAKAIDSNGWFYTGDLGRLEGQRLWITGRKKDIIVMANGKNVGPEGIENLLKASQYIEEVMVIGDDMDYIAALIVPVPEMLKHFCHENELDTSHLNEMVEYLQVRDLIKKEIDNVNKRLPDFERVKKFVLLPYSWTQETGEMTPTLKIKRRVIREKFAKEIASIS